MKQQPISNTETKQTQKKNDPKLTRKEEEWQSGRCSGIKLSTYKSSSLQNLSDRTASSGVFLQKRILGDRKNWISEAAVSSPCGIIDQYLILAKTEANIWDDPPPKEDALLFFFSLRKILNDQVLLNSSVFLGLYLCWLPRFPSSSHCMRKTQKANTHTTQLLPWFEKPLPFLFLVAKNG